MRLAHVVSSTSHVAHSHLHLSYDMSHICMSHITHVTHMHESQHILSRNTLANRHRHISLHRTTTFNQCVAVCCSVLQCVAVSCSVWPCVTVCGSLLQRVAMRCSEFPPTLSSGAIAHQSRHNPLHLTVRFNQRVAVYYSMLQCVAACYSVLQHVAVCSLPPDQATP